MSTRKPRSPAQDVTLPPGFGGYSAADGIKLPPGLQKGGASVGKQAVPKASEVKRQSGGNK
jgi:hypothetical protein